MPACACSPCGAGETHAAFGRDNFGADGAHHLQGAEPLGKLDQLVGVAHGEIEFYQRPARTLLQDELARGEIQFAADCLDGDERVSRGVRVGSDTNMAQKVAREQTRFYWTQRFEDSEGQYGRAD